MRILATCVFLVAVSAFGLASAATTDDIIDMAKKGANDEQLLKEVDAAPGEFNMGATQVIALREAKVSDKVIAAMLRHVNTQPPAPRSAVAANPSAPLPPEQPLARVNQPAPRVTPQGVQAALANANSPGRLTLDNLDDRTYAYFFEPAIQTMWIGAPNGNAGTIRGHSAQTLSMKPGQYHIRYQGMQEAGVTVTIYPGELSSISLSRVMMDNTEVLQATAFERGERKATAKLAPVAALVNLPREPVVERNVIDVPTYVERPTYYYDSPTVIYSRPYYSYSRPYYYGSGYYGGGYYRGGGSGVNLGISIGGGSHWRR